jgi:hypothetical protein
LSKTAEQDRPSKVIIVIITDGEENASKEFSKDQVSKMIKHQTDAYQWEFVYIGANQDAFKNANSMGINISNVTNFDANSRGVKSYSCAVSDHMSLLRGYSDDNDSLQNRYDASLNVEDPVDVT